MVIGSQILYRNTGGADDTGIPGDNPAGRFIPTTSVIQYSATLANWMSVNNNDLPTVFPNLGNFAIRGLGFMTS